LLIAHLPKFSPSKILSCTVFLTAGTWQDIIWRESLAGKKFGEFTRFEHLTKKVSNE